MQLIKSKLYIVDLCARSTLCHPSAFDWRRSQKVSDVVYAGHMKPGLTLCLNRIWDVARTVRVCSREACTGWRAVPVWRERRVGQTGEETGVYNINAGEEAPELHEQPSGNGVYSGLFLGQMYHQPSVCFVYLCIPLWCAPHYWLNTADLAVMEYKEPGVY